MIHEKKIKEINSLKQKIKNLCVKNDLDVSTIALEDLYGILLYVFYTKTVDMPLSFKEYLDFSLKGVKDKALRLHKKFEATKED